MRTRALAVATATLALTLGAPPASAGAAESPAPPTPPTLQALVVSTQLWVGDNDLVLELLDGAGGRFADPAPTAGVELTGPDGLVRGTYPLERIRLASTGRHLHRARVALDAQGPWTARVSATIDTQPPLEGGVRFEVLEDAGTPALGQPAVSVRTPTIAWGPIASITSDRDPVPQLYWWSLDEALDAGKPILFVIDTARPGVSDGCGSAMGEARLLRGSFPGLVVIHAEPFVYGDAGAVVTGADQGPARIAPWAEAWGVTGPPWMFVIAPDGTVSAKFQGVFGTDELLSALRRITPYAPGGH